jgi:hypothetical protein
MLLHLNSHLLVTVRYCYGEFDAKKEKLTGDPYIQMLSITSLDTAIADFRTSRLRTIRSGPPEASPDFLKEMFGGGNAGDANDATVLAVADTSSSNSTASLSDVMDRVNHYGPIIIGLLAGTVFIGIIIAAIVVYMCVRRGITVSRKRPTTYAPVFTKDEPFRVDEKHIYSN